MIQQSTVKRKVAKAKSTNNGNETKPRTRPTISRNGNSLKLLKRIGYSNIHILTDDETAFFYDAGTMIDADGAYHAYHPKGKPGLDFLELNSFFQSTIGRLL
jgi:hypothetical protein